MSPFFRTALLLSALACPWLAHAVPSCEIDGQSVNPTNGNTTAGKTGLMRCREAEGGPVARGEELRNGTAVGLPRSWLASGKLRDKLEYIKSWARPGVCCATKNSSKTARARRWRAESPRRAAPHPRFPGVHLGIRP